MNRILRLAGLLWAASLSTSTAELWTNQANQTIAGTLKRCDGTQVTLVRTNGALLTLPVSALCASDQRRVRLLSAQSIVPEFVRRAYVDAQSVLHRFESLPEGQRTADGRGKAIHMACAVFDARINARAAELQDQGVQTEVRALRAALARGPKE